MNGILWIAIGSVAIPIGILIGIISIVIGIVIAIILIVIGIVVIAIGIICIAIGFAIGLAISTVIATLLIAIGMVAIATTTLATYVATAPFTLFPVWDIVHIVLMLVYNDTTLKKLEVWEILGVNWLKVSSIFALVNLVSSIVEAFCEAMMFL